MKKVINKVIGISLALVLASTIFLGTDRIELKAYATNDSLPQVQVSDVINPIVKEDAVVAHYVHDVPPSYDPNAAGDFFNSPATYDLKDKEVQAIGVYLVKIKNLGSDSDYTATINFSSGSRSCHINIMANNKTATCTIEINSEVGATLSDLTTNGNLHFEYTLYKENTRHVSSTNGMITCSDLFRLCQAHNLTNDLLHIKVTSDNVVNYEKELTLAPGKDADLDGFVFTGDADFKFVVNAKTMTSPYTVYACPEGSTLYTKVNGSPYVNKCVQYQSGVPIVLDATPYTEYVYGEYRVVDTINVVPVS